MATRSIEVQAFEIASSFSNGNIAWAVSQVTQAKNKKVSALLAVKVYMALQDARDGSMASSFVRALHNRMVS